MTTAPTVTVTADVLGIGLIGPGLAGWDAARAVLRGEADHDAAARTAVPPPQRLPPAGASTSATPNVSGSGRVACSGCGYGVSLATSSSGAPPGAPSGVNAAISPAARLVSNAHRLVDACRLPTAMCQ